MKILVDTSAWVDYLNGHPSPERAALADLVVSDHEICTCGVVIAEVFQDSAGRRVVPSWLSCFGG